MHARKEIEALVYSSERGLHLRSGRGFSLNELKEAELNLNDAEKFGIRIDNRRRSSHPHNVKTLRENYGEVIPLTEIKGIGEVASKRLKKAGIADTYELAKANLRKLSKETKYTKRTLTKWQKKAEKILK